MDNMERARINPKGRLTYSTTWYKEVKKSNRTSITAPFSLTMREVNKLRETINQRYSHKPVYLVPLMTLHEASVSAAVDYAEHISMILTLSAVVLFLCAACYYTFFRKDD